MSSNVFANGREISGKSDGNMSNGAMPDICLTPPPPPAGPIPIPYPNFSSDSDSDDGTADVQIGSKLVGQKNKSTFKKSTGDEAATKSQGMGLVTANIQGPTKHAAWSFDVKFENENVTRHLDLTTHNHASDPMDTGAVTVKMGTISLASPADDDDCAQLQQQNHEKRAELKQGKTSSTVTHAKYTPASGPSKTLWSCSRKLSGIGDPSYCAGLPYNRPVTVKNADGKYKKAKKAAPTKLCAEATDSRSFGYSNDINIRNPHTSHTESRIVETLMGSGNVSGGTLKMAINWNSSGGMADVPCADCHRVVCAAAACGLNIVLCSDEKPDPCKKDLSGSY